MQACCGVAAGHRLRRATLEELQSLKAAGVLQTCATKAILISVDAAISACARAGAAAPLLAAMAGIPWLQAHVARLPQALPAPPSGAPCIPFHAVNPLSEPRSLFNLHNMQCRGSGEGAHTAAGATEREQQGCPNPEPLERHGGPHQTAKRWRGSGKGTAEPTAVSGAA